jgi:putative ATP-dependent endonuclease of the OLD family
MTSHIRRLTIERFRGIEKLTWHPAKGLNILLGGGDVGKTTILESVSLLLNPSYMYSVSDADYWQRDVDAEFTIEAVMSLTGVDAINQQSAMNWPWLWDGENPVLPSGTDDDNSRESSRETVYCLRVRGTSELDLEYEVIQPDESVASLPVGLRRQIGLVRLVGRERDDRDLRMLRGSGLDRLLSDPGLRSRIGRQLASEEIKTHLSEDAQETLAELNKSFQERVLPADLGLGIVGGPGASLNALIGLTSRLDSVALPLGTWGTGTRRLATLAIADALQQSVSVTIIDEIERGLEPYRQRKLIQTLMAGDGQAFVTTHSAACLSAASRACAWYLDSAGRLGQLPSEKIAKHQESDPEIFLSRLTVVCEGATEVGFVSFLLEKAIGSLLDHGIWITDGRGHESALGLLEAMSEGGLAFAGIVDDEGKYPERWRKVKESLQDLLLQWPSRHCIEQHVIPLIQTRMLPGLIEDPDGDRTGQRLRSLAERLGIIEKDFESVSEAAEGKIAKIIIEAASGTVPEEHAGADKHTKGNFKGHSKFWFKSVAGGEELASKALALGAWPELKPLVLPFVNGVRRAVELAPIRDLPGE